MNRVPLYVGAVSYTHLDVYKRQPIGYRAGRTRFCTSRYLSVGDTIITEGALARNVGDTIKSYHIESTVGHAVVTTDAFLIVDNHRAKIGMADRSRRASLCAGGIRTVHAAKLGKDPLRCV